MRRNSLALRLVASAALWCALLLSAGGYALSALFADTIETNFDARLMVLLEGVVAGTEIDAGGALQLRPQLGEPRFDQPYSGWYWQIESRGEARPLARSASLWDQSLPLVLPEGKATAQHDAIGPQGRSLRLVIREIRLPGAEEPFLFVVAGDREEIAIQTVRFNRLLALSLGGLFLGLLLAILVQVRFGLEPLRRMRRSLAAIRAGRARRLEGEFAEEIRPLAVELNGLLDHSEALVERARTHVGNLAHGLKTPLAVLTNEIARHEGPFAEVVRRQVGIMRHQVEHHLARARTVATARLLGARTEVAPVLADLARTLARIHVDRGVGIACRCADGLAFHGARQDLEEMLGNLLDNACKWARGGVEVVAAAEGEHLIVIVDDDGPGLPPERRAEVLERGRRLDERVPGSGLGLAIVVDLAEIHGGALALDDSPLGGLRARLTLPTVAPDGG
jgi:signal transduction histidine kinase